jgi:hypothetical protein
MPGDQTRPEAEPVAPWPLVAAGVSLLASVIALIAAAGAGAPYLTFDDLNPWIVVFAITAFGALMATPFAIDRALDRLHPQEADHWEKAMAAWGGICLLITAIAALMVFGGDFSAARHLADAAGVIGLVEAGSALCVLLVWLVGG